MMFLLMALVQVPFGLVTLNLARMSKRLTHPLDGGGDHWTSREIFFLSIMLGCCVFAGIGLVDGFRKKRVGPIVVGVLVGLVLAAIEFYVLSFLSLCLELFNL